MKVYVTKKDIAILKRSIPIEPIVAQDCELSSRGEYSVGDSPFSSVRDHPLPIYVNKRLNRFKCEACEESGDVIAYVQRRNGMGFLEAVRYLAEMIGYELAPRAQVSRKAPPLHPELNFDWNDAA